MTIPLKPSVLIDDKVGAFRRARMPDDGEELEPFVGTYSNLPFPEPAPLSLDKLRESMLEIKRLAGRPFAPSPFLALAPPWLARSLNAFDYDRTEERNTMHTVNVTKLDIPDGHEVRTVERQHYSFDSALREGFVPRAMWQEQGVIEYEVTKPGGNRYSSEDREERKQVAPVTVVLLTRDPASSIATRVKEVEKALEGERAAVVKLKAAEKERDSYKLDAELAVTYRDELEALRKRHAKLEGDLASVRTEIGADRFRAIVDAANPDHPF